MFFDMFVYMYFSFSCTSITLLLFYNKYIVYIGFWTYEERGIKYEKFDRAKFDPSLS